VHKYHSECIDIESLISMYTTSGIRVESYPVQKVGIYVATKWIAENGYINVNSSRLAVVVTA
jgi:hypothetical protein